MKYKSQYIYTIANMFDIAETIYIKMLNDLNSDKIKKTDIREKTAELVENFARFI